MIHSARSLAYTPRRSVPFRVIFIDLGTRNQVSPRLYKPAASVRSIPTARVLKAPAVQVWLSLPAMIIPGRACPAINWWQMPFPTS